jgi:hypothetical protein
VWSGSMWRVTETVTGAEVMGRGSRRRRVADNSAASPDGRVVS